MAVTQLLILGAVFAFFIYAIGGGEGEALDIDEGGGDDEGGEGNWPGEGQLLGGQHAPAIVLIGD